jgi:hypothetical protein
MNKTDRKNKTKQVVNWPTNGEYFTIKSLLGSNSEFKQITLRVRLDKAIKSDKSVSVIGYRNNKKGRPEMILAMNPVSQTLLDKAYNEGIQKPESDQTNIINVSDVNNTAIPTSDHVHSLPSTEIPVNNPIQTHIVAE